MDPAGQSPEEITPFGPSRRSQPATGSAACIMAGLRAAHGGPAFDPHATVVGAIRLRRSAAIEALRDDAAGVRPYTARVAGVARGDFFYQCVYLLLEPTPEVVDAAHQRSLLWPLWVSDINPIHATRQPLTWRPDR
ncbi:hypothetical protein GUJ93_ZPchr0628g40557 [Zizania palustris]|uniref:Uncharacterized protein n=1 Tax=Zizania palustris TaxID=103762 RepID=A0A8J5W6P0_ZIZPA|nr:hypothetical protein GUJ93_ZPchr0628g40557 [Zizania palustris]